MSKGIKYLIELKKHQYYFILFLIIFFALFLRLYQLSQLPVSLNPDEAALGYTAYSLLQTGRDEHGKFLPLTLQSFGDWKLPVYSYIDIIPVGLFGLSEFTVRFPSVIAGVVSVILIYSISRLLFDKKRTSIFAALFYALSPWNIYFSRAAYEVNVATCIFLAGIFFFLKYIYKKHVSIAYLFFAMLLFGITLFTHHSYIAFTPLFVFLWILISKKNLIWNKKLFVGVLFFTVFVISSYISLALEGGNKVSTLSVFNDKNILYERVERLRGDNAIKNQFLERVLHTRYLGGFYQVMQNYINSFSPSFLFDKGGEKLVHNAGSFGNFYLFDCLLLIVGMLSMFWNREPSLKFILLWLIIAPIPSAITRDAPNSTRLFPMLPAFVLIAAYGANEFFLILKKKTLLQISIKLALAALFIINVVYFIDAYYIHFNTQRIRFWRYGYKEAVLLSQMYPKYNVVMRGPENFPYIYFLFYTKYNPHEFISTVEYYPPTPEGFYFVKKFGKYQFVNNIDYGNILKNTLYIDDTRLDDKSHPIYLPSGEPILGYFIKDFEK